MLRVLFLLLTCIYSVVITAQEKSDFFTPSNIGKDQVFYGGLTAGANFSTVAGDSYGGYKKVGFVGGGTVYVRLLPKLLANVELLYTQKGSRGVAQKTSAYSGAFFERFWLDLNYIEVPLLIHYTFTPRLHVGVGGSYGRLIGSSEEVYTDQPVTINPDETTFNTEDFNYVLGAGWQIGKGWFLMARYQRSARSIRVPQNIPLFQNSFSQYNDLFSLRLMYLIGD